MYSHVTIGSNDIAGARAFYDPVLATLGIARFFERETALGYGEPRGTRLWVMTPFDGRPATAGNGIHVAFLAPTRAAVRAFHAAALAHGGSDEGAPGPRPHYHRNYYGAYVRDRDGNKLQACCHGPVEEVGE
jgi:catechol 2,3-dioxygenase-like lactoylglutathione lyase family enzyme